MIPRIILNSLSHLLRLIQNLKSVQFHQLIVKYFFVLYQLKSGAKGDRIHRAGNGKILLLDLRTTILAEPEGIVDAKPPETLNQTTAEELQQKLACFLILDSWG